MINLNEIKDEYREHFAYEIIHSLEMQVLLGQIESIARRAYFDNEDELTDDLRLEAIINLCKEIYFVKTDHHPYHIFKDCRQKVIRKRNLVRCKLPRSAWDHD